MVEALEYRVEHAEPFVPGEVAVRYYDREPAPAIDIDAIMKAMTRGKVKIQPELERGATPREMAVKLVNELPAAQQAELGAQPPEMVRSLLYGVLTGRSL